MNRERLELMVTMLSEVVAKKWVMSPEVGPELERLQRKVQQPRFDLDYWGSFSCGFSACAVGHAGLDDRFRCQGLKTDIVTSSVDLFELKHGVMVHTGEYGFDAVRMFFDIEEDTAKLLFLSTYYDFNEAGETVVTQSMVIQRLLYLLEHGEDGFLEEFEDYTK